MSDITNCFKKMNIIFSLSLSDLNARYKNSILGPLWISLGTGIFIFGIAFLWGELFNKDRNSFVPSVTVGMIMWYFISSCINESTSIFSDKSQIIKNLRLPLSMFPFQVVIRQAINFFHNFSIFIIVFFIYDLNLGKNFFYFFPMMFLVIINMLWISLLFSILGARFNDFRFVVSSILPLIFFMTPVLYNSSDLVIFHSLLWFNPFTHFIEIVRAPLTDSFLNLNSVMFCIVLLIFGWIFTIYVFNNTKHRIIFWI